MVLHLISSGDTLSSCQSEPSFVSVCVYLCAVTVAYSFLHQDSLAKISKGGSEIGKLFLGNRILYQLLTHDQQMALLLETAKLTLMYLLWAIPLTFLHGTTHPYLYLQSAFHERSDSVTLPQSTLWSGARRPFLGEAACSLCNLLRNSHCSRPARNLAGSLGLEPACPLPVSALGPGLVNIFPSGMLHLAALPGQTTATCTLSLWLLAP